jgi:hypothetical protein
MAAKFIFSGQSVKTILPLTKIFAGYTVVSEIITTTFAAKIKRI